jgi:hypothetical protein
MSVTDVGLVPYFISVTDVGLLPNCIMKQQLT